MKQHRKEVKQSKASDKVSEPPALGIDDDLDMAAAPSEFGRNSNFSFASGVFNNNLKGRAKTIKDK